MNLLRRTFFIDEPLNKAVDLCTSVKNSCPALEEYCTKTLPGLSHKAIDDDGNIVGVLINAVTPLTEEHKLEEQIAKCDDPKFKKILHILLFRENGATIWDKFPDDKEILDVKLAATAPEWRKKGIMNVLMAETEKTAKENGIRLIRMDTSSAYSAIVAENFGFECLYSRPYSEILLDGEPIIVPEPPHCDDKVFVKQLF